MWLQIRTLLWAQWLTLRNRLPRTNIGTLLSLSLAIVWYGGFLTLAIILGFFLNSAPLPLLRHYVAAGLLLVFLFWQLMPLLTLTGGWSLDLKKLQIYPLSTDTLLLMEAVLQVTSGMEMMLVLAGSFFAFALRPDTSILSALGLLLWVPFNLLIALLTRDIFLHAFRKSRLREIFTVLLISVGLLPQLLVRLGWIRPLQRWSLVVSNWRWAPWHNVAAIATGLQPAINTLAIVVWIVAAWSLARKQFGSAIREEEAVTTSASRSERSFSLNRLLEIPARWFADPISALMVKEIRTLLRMPRFRVVFLLSSLISVFVWVPFNAAGSSRGFAAQNFLSIANLYGLIVLGDVLMGNIFGFERSAAQFYFATPVDIRAVFRAKNAVAALFVLLQTMVAVSLSLLLRLSVTFSAVATGLCVSVAVGIFYLAAGNMTSVLMPRSMDPRAMVKKQTTSVQVWILGCMLGGLVLTGFAWLAGWATDSAWASRGVLAVEFVIGAICYRVSLDSAIAKIGENQEQMLDALSKGLSSPMAS